MRTGRIARAVKLADLSRSQLQRRLADTGLSIRTGPVVSRIRSRLPAVVEGITLHYAPHPALESGEFADFDVRVDRPQGWRRWWRPQVEFRVDGEAPFAPLPGDQGFPMLEWGLNWCITSHCHQFLILHAAVVERDGHAMSLPAPPGSGKSTLCAGLIHRGWRLLSDELAVIDPATLELLPIPRPVSLKNGSIDVIRAWAPEAAFGPVVRETNKGAVAHCRPPVEAVASADRRATTAWIVLPKWIPGAEARLTALSNAQSMMRLIDNAFNYNVHGAVGFQTLADLVERSRSYEFEYASLDDAVRCLGGLPIPEHAT